MQDGKHTDDGRLIEECRKLSSYEVNKVQFIEEINSQGILLRHKKSGARVVLVSNDDENKVFSIAFRTTPKDSTGAPHIIEHSVLCGSREFPLKDPFVELVKGSMNTFLNAMTYPDKTMYPVASCNDQDFQNLMHVYLDAVFYPAIYEHEEIFCQEGWHYELDSVDDELRYNGVVYNEMKGVFSSPGQQLARTVMNSLFPDNVYGVESGGEPEHIVELSYEEFLDFHREYYHPSNSYIYLYGDMDMAEKLKWLDEAYLSGFDGIIPDSGIEMQEPFTKPAYVEEIYSVSEEEAEEPNHTYYTYNAVVETSLDKTLYLAFQVLEYVLVDAPGAALKQALLDAGLGSDIMCTFENGIKQPYFSVIAKDAGAGETERFVRVVRDTLAALIKEGLDKKSILAAINSLEFRAREADFGSYPKGLVYGMQMMDSWLYDDNQPFLHLGYNEVFAFLKKEAEEGYFEGLLQRYLLDNAHVSIVTMSPQTGLEEQLAKQMQDKLRSYRDTLSQEDLLQIAEDTRKLKEYQETPNTPEELATIPLLKREDIKKQVRPVINEEHQECGITVLHHNIFSNGICYMSLNYDISEYQEYASYIAFLATVLGYVDTENYTYLDFNNEMNLYTGGISTDAKFYTNCKEKGKYKLCFEVRTKVFYEYMPIAFGLLEEMVYHTKLEDDRRLKEVVAECRSRMQMRLQSSGHSAAAARAMSGISQADRVNDAMNGIGYYRFLEQVDNHFEEEKENLKRVLRYLLTGIFKNSRLIVSCTADMAGYECFAENFKKYREKTENILKDNLTKESDGTENALLTKEDMEKADIMGKIDFSDKAAAKCKKQGFKTTGKVQYVARAGNYMQAGYEYSGILSVLKTVLSYEYLWKNVRVLGGAYGAMCFFGFDGDCYFVSYRDPELAKTDAAYKGVPEYIRSLDLDERELTKYIIGTMSDADAPLSPAAAGRRSFRCYMMERSKADIQKDREQILSMTLQDLRNMADLIEGALQQDYFCVIGNEKVIEENAGMFDAVEILN